MEIDSKAYFFEEWTWWREDIRHCCDHNTQNKVYGEKLVRKYAGFLSAIGCVSLPLYSTDTTGSIRRCGKLIDNGCTDNAGTTWLREWKHTEYCVLLTRHRKCSSGVNTSLPEDYQHSTDDQ